MRIEWSEIAFADLVDIRNYIARDTPFYADQFIDRLMAATDRLADFPELGRRVPEAENDGENIRELIFHSYRIVYQVDKPEKCILIITVVHGSRDLAGQDPKPWDIV